MDLAFSMSNWTKSEQSPESRMTEGLQQYVLRLSTVGCTADVGKYGISEKSVRPKKMQASTLQQNASPTQVGELGLQGINLTCTDRQLQFHTIGREAFFHHQTPEFRNAQLHQG